MKFFIVGLHSSGKQEILETLEELGVQCGKIFSNITNPSNNIYNSFNYEQYDDEEVKQIFENNAYVFYKDIYELPTIYEGLSLYEFDNNQVFALSPDQFLSIPMKSLQEQICIIWLDNNLLDRQNRFRIENRTYNFKNRDNIERINQEDYVHNLYNFPNSRLLYFCNEDPQRVSAIIYSMVKHNDLIDIYTKKFN